MRLAGGGERGAFMTAGGGVGDRGDGISSSKWSLVLSAEVIEVRDVLLSIERGETAKLESSSLESRGDRGAAREMGATLPLPAARTTPAEVVARFIAVEEEPVTDLERGLTLPEDAELANTSSAPPASKSPNTEEEGREEETELAAEDSACFNAASLFSFWICLRFFFFFF